MWPAAARAQYQRAARPIKRPPPPDQAPAAAPADNSVGQVATLQGDATVTRGNAAATALQVADPIFKNDTLATGANSALGVTFDDDTTFSLSADTRIVVNEFVYQQGGGGNCRFVQGRDRHRRLRRQPGRQDRRHDDLDAR